MYPEFGLFLPALAGVWVFTMDCEATRKFFSSSSRKFGHVAFLWEKGPPLSFFESSLAHTGSVSPAMLLAWRVFGRRARATTTFVRTCGYRSDGGGGDGSYEDPSSSDSSFVDRAEVRRMRAAEKRRLRALRGTGSDGVNGVDDDDDDGGRRRRSGRRSSSSSPSSSSSSYRAFESFVEGMERTGRRASDGFGFGARRRGRRGERAFDSSAQAKAAFEAFVRARLRNESFGGGGGGSSSSSSSSFEDFFSSGGSNANANANGFEARHDDGFYAGASCPHCAILGLKAKSFVTWDALKTALRTQAMKWHPDRHADEDKTRAEANFKRVYDAYAALSSNR